jgi:two-component system, chemotaxis family, CheB/CheR fusion protein
MTVLNEIISARCRSELNSMASALGRTGISALIIDFDTSTSSLLISDANLPFQDFTGYAAGELIGKAPRLLPALFNRSVLCQLNRSLLNGQVFRSESTIARKGGDECAVEWTISPIRDEHGAPRHWIVLLRDVTHARRLRQEFEAELQHRTRNLLGMVQSLASRTLKETDEATALGSRLAALGRVQGLQTCAEGTVDLGELICREMGAHGAADERVKVEGEAIAFPRAKAEMLALAVHELTTSARKHGALSSRAGALSVRWRRHGSSGRRQLALQWEEICARPSDAMGLSKGYDRELLERTLHYSLGATTKLEIGSDGVRCQIDIPLPEAAG